MSYSNEIYNFYVFLFLQKSINQQTHNIKKTSTIYVFNIPENYKTDLYQNFEVLKSRAPMSKKRQKTTKLCQRLQKKYVYLVENNSTDR